MNFKVYFVLGYACFMCICLKIVITKIFSKMLCFHLPDFTGKLLLQPLRWCCVDCVIHHERDVREEQHHTYLWREQAIIE